MGHLSRAVAGLAFVGIEACELKVLLVFAGNTLPANTNCLSR